MNNYNNLILEILPGTTPREKYEKLKALQDILVKACYPRRGTEEANWELYEVVEKITPYFITHDEAVNR